MAGEGNKIYACRSATHAAAGIDGLTHAQIVPRSTGKEARNPILGGVEDAAVVDSDVRVRLFGHNQNALIALIGDAADDVVVQAIGAAGALEKCTVKDVMLTTILSDVDIPERDGGGKVAPFGIEGPALFGDSDTLATMMVWAAGA